MDGFIVTWDGRAPRNEPVRLRRIHVRVCWTANKSHCCSRVFSFFFLTDQINVHTYIHTCRFYRDVGMRGWTGGDDGTKVMMFEADMPHCTEASCNWDRPAVWALNARVSATGSRCVDFLCSRWWVELSWKGRCVNAGKISRQGRESRAPREPIPRLPLKE